MSGRPLQRPVRQLGLSSHVLSHTQRNEDLEMRLFLNWLIRYSNILREAEKEREAECICVRVCVCV